MRQIIRRMGGRLLALAVAALLLAGCAQPLVDKAAYVTAVLDQAQRAGAGISALSGLAGSPQLADPAWRDQVAAEVAALRGVVGEARALTPPEALAGAHQTYLDALTQLDQAVTSVEQAVAASDPARLSAALPLLSEAAALLTAAQGLVSGG